MEMKQPMRIFCRDPRVNLNMAVRGHKVILVPADPGDKTQHWIKDDSSLGNLTDDEGSRPFALVNVITGQAMVNIGGNGIVKLAPYSNHVAVELSKLWTMGEKDDNGFAAVRVLQDLEFSLNGIFGNVKEGTEIWTYYTGTGDNSMWKIVPVNE